jgi:hypothetical protein
MDEQTLNKFLLLLSDEPWEEIFRANTNDPDTMFNKFLNTYIKYYDNCFLKKYVNQNHRYNAWITKGIITSCKKKKELFTQTRISNNHKLKTYYKKYCSVLTKIIRSAKKLHYNNIIARSKNKMKSTWQIIHKEMGKPQPETFITKLETPNKTITNQTEIANTFNRYFTTIADNIRNNNNNNVKLQNKNPIKYLVKQYTNPFPKINWKYVSSHEIVNIIKGLKPKRTTGYDEISINILKISAPYIISPLTYICNTTLNTGIFPNRLKYAVIKPLYKNGNKHELSNYRPISLLTAFSKIFEKVMYNRLYKHLEVNNILAKEQFGFRPNHSTEQAAFTLINCILNAMNNNQTVGGIFCDLTKAFDCVDHDILLDKLMFYGVHGKFKSLIESYLRDRYQTVSLGNINSSYKDSKWLRTSCGVPQGSILGPLLFLIYINDLPSLSRKDSNIVLYADDTTIIYTNSNKTNYILQISSLLADLNNWFQSNLLNLNLNKTNYLEFNATKRQEEDTQLKCANISIPTITHTKFLGLIIDNTLSWNSHIDSLIRKMSSFCYALSQIKHSVPNETLKLIYCAHIHSIMSYGLIFWGTSPLANKVFILQKKIIRIITNTNNRSSCKQHFKNLRIMTLYSQYIFSIIMFTTNNKHLFSSNSEIHKYDTRSNNLLHPPLTNLTKCKKGPYINGIKIYNHLPQQLKRLEQNPNHFAVALKRFLYYHSFYSINEYLEYKESKQYLQM